MLKSIDKRINNIIVQKNKLRSIQRKITNLTNEYYRVSSKMSVYQNQIQSAIINSEELFDKEGFKK